MYRLIFSLIALLPFTIGTGLNLLAFILNFQNEAKRQHFFYFTYVNIYYMAAVLTFYFHGIIPALGMLAFNKALPGLNLGRN